MSPYFSRIRHMIFFCTLLVHTILTNQALGEEMPMVTDRPGQSDSSSVVPAGTFQLEAGYLMTHNDTGTGETTQHTLPTMLWRTGLMERFELRFGWDAYLWQNNSPGADPEGTGDGLIGTKIYFRPADGWKPEAALNVSFFVPFGNAGLSRERVDPLIRLLFTNILTDKLSVTYNIGTEWSTGAGSGGGLETIGNYTYTFSPAYLLNDQWSVFAEVFGQVPMEPGNDSHTFDGGFLWLVTPEWQLDFSAGAGLTDSANDLFVTVGVSTRWP